MGKKKAIYCPRCAGRMFVDRDIDGWYEQCINCSFKSELKVISKPGDNPLRLTKVSLLTGKR